MKTRESTRIAIVAAMVALFPSFLHGQILSAKRGFSDSGANYNNLQATGAGWYYTWGTGPASPGSFDANFYPMFWNGPSQSTINTALARNPQYMLGFNEPERSDQANMTVAQAISSWTTISSSTIAYNAAHGTSIKLVSPAVADTGGSSGGQQWLASFMSQANANGLKVDAVAFHWYDISTPTDPAGAASQFLGRVDSYHNSYGLPVFITEFAIHDWDGNYSDAQMIDANRQFLNIIIPGLESRSYVAGYCWYNWFSDSPLYSGSPPTPTQMGYSYIGAVGSGSTANISGTNLGEHVAYLSGGTLTMTSSVGTVKYINTLANTSTITGSIDWGLNSSSTSNWVRIQSGATLTKTGTNTITLGGGSITNNGTLTVSGGVLRLGGGVTGSGSINIPSDGGSTGSTARLELNGNITVSNPITFAQRNDPGGSDGIRSVSGYNMISGQITIAVGGNQARVRSDAGMLMLSGPITTNATTARNLYLQGAAGGIVNGPISDNAGNASGIINLWKEGAGTWTLSGTNTYTGTTTVNAGTLQLSGSSTIGNVANAATLEVLRGNYTAGSISGAGSTLIDAGVSLAAASVVQNTVTLGAGARLTIAAIAGGPSSASPLTTVPEPSAITLLAIGVMCLLGYSWRRRQ